MKLKFILFKNLYAVCKIKTRSDLDTKVFDSDFYSISKSGDELSLICEQSLIPESPVEIEKNWKILKVMGKLDFSLTGIISEISGILKAKKIPIFTISTYETDHILVKSSDIGSAINALKSSGHEVLPGK